jgi:hypothetical protein
MIHIVARSLKSVVTSTLLATVAVSIGSAQMPGVGIVTPIDTINVIVPGRSVDEIKKDLEMIQSHRTRAKATLIEAEAQVRRIEKQIEAKEAETKSLESLVDSAKQAKRESDVTALKAQIDGVEKIVDLLDMRKDMRSAEVKAAEATVDYAQAAEDMFEREIAVMKKRDERLAQGKTHADSVALSVMDRMMRELEGGFLESRITALKKHERLLSREIDLAERQMKVTEAQNAFLEKGK